jgi:hypothetical protein
LVRHAGTQFDPVIVGALLSSLDAEADAANSGTAGTTTAGLLLEKSFGDSRGALQSA